jgi:UDP-N-acetylglucosamine 2-epimerase (non-hydrolysing)
MRENQGLADVTARIVTGMTGVIREYRPDWLLVQGDTTTAFVAALAAFYEKVSVGHVEAGLRTGFKYSPWPEEMNRQLVGRLADLHFPPTERAKKALLSENVPDTRIHVTGNTVVDALLRKHRRSRSRASSRATIPSGRRRSRPARRSSSGPIARASSPSRSASSTTRPTTAQ